MLHSVFQKGCDTIETMGTHMIVGNICEFLDSLIKRFFRSEFIQVYALIFQCVEITLHWCVVIWVTCFALHLPILRIR